MIEQDDDARACSKRGYLGVQVCSWIIWAINTDDKNYNYWTFKRFEEWLRYDGDTVDWEK